jgi:hypothetical protein
MNRDVQRLSREVQDLWRDEVARATAADARHRPRDTLVKVRVTHHSASQGPRCYRVRSWKFRIGWSRG